jgi:hypothetical protein
VAATSRPVPGPQVAASASPVTAGDPATAPAVEATAGHPAGHEPFAGLADRPVAEHVAAFEAEHARLQRELSTIDQL